jgi:hypothetical protein
MPAPESRLCTVPTCETCLVDPSASASTGDLALPLPPSCRGAPGLWLSFSEPSGLISPMYAMFTQSRCNPIVISQHRFNQHPRKILARGIGREHHFGCTVGGVGHDASEVGRLERRIRSPGSHATAPKACLPPRADACAQRSGRREPVLEELLAAEALEIWVLHPTVAQPLVGQIRLLRWRGSGGCPRYRCRLCQTHHARPSAGEVRSAPTGRR